MAEPITINHPAEAAAVAEIVRKSVEPKILTLSAYDAETSEAQVLLVPGTHGQVEVKSVKALVDEYRVAPERRRGTAVVADLDSFIAHAKRFADADSALFADPDPKAPTLTAVLDYHQRGANGSPRFGAHRTRYDFPVSDEWRAWKAKNRTDVMAQGEFAEFIENRILDVLDPAGAGEQTRALAATFGCDFATPTKLLELSKGLAVRVGARVQNVVNLGTGEAQVAFVTQHQDETGAPLKVPGAFLIAIPVFRGGALYQIAVRLRYRVREGQIGWFYEMCRTDAVFDDAFREACATAQTQTGLPLFVGKPEA